jgi:hypothetical protein
MAAQGGLGASLIIQYRKRLRSVRPRNEVGMSEKCPKIEQGQRVFQVGAQVLFGAANQPRPI